MIKKVVSLMLAACVLMSVLAGCGGGPSPSGSGVKSGDKTSNTITVWAWSPELNKVAMDEAAELYRKTVPDFQVDFVELSRFDIQTKITAAVVSQDMSTLPDVVLFQDMTAQKFLANYGDAFMDLSGIDIDFNNFSPIKVAYGNYDGKQYGIPFDSGTMIAAYRLDYLDAAGYTLEDFTDITWSEFMEKSEKVRTATGKSMITDYLGTGFVANMCKAAGDSLVNEDGSVNFVNNNTLKTAMQTYLDLVNSGTLTVVAATDEHIGAINQGSSCCVMDGCWRMANILACPEEQSGKWGITNIPRLDNVEGATNYSTYGGSSWYVTSNCKNKELVFDFFAKTFGSDASLYDTILAKTGTPADFLPAESSATYNEPQPWFNNQIVYADILEFSKKIPNFTPTPYQDDFNSAIGTALSNLLYNGADLDAEIAAAAETVNFSIGG